MKSNLFLMTIIFMCFQADAFAGGVDGGGGKSVVCRDANAKITSAETLDLYEAKHVYGLKPKTFTGTLDQAVTAIEADLQMTMDQPEIHLFPLFRRVRKIMKFVSPSVVLKPVDDAAEAILPSECQLEQLAHYIDDDLLLVSEEIWNALSLTDKAALITHEAIYRMHRTNGATDSRRSRKVVGHLLSGFQFEPVRSGLPSSAKLCVAKQGDKVTFMFAYYPASSETMTKLQFLSFEGQPVFSKKTAIVPLKLPWIQKVTANCTDASNGCNIAGGDTASSFEGAGFLTVGIEQKTSAPTPKSKFYLLTNSGRHYLSCHP